MVLGNNCQIQGVLLILIIVLQGSTEFAVGAGGGCLSIFFLSTMVSRFYLSLSLFGKWLDQDRNTL